MRLPKTAHTSRPWRVHELTGGVPRTILLACQHSLDIADSSHKSGITPELMERGYAELSLRGADTAGA